jgi:outer membrane receptor for ferrienterochelin and colicins
MGAVEALRVMARTQPTAYVVVAFSHRTLLVMLLVGLAGGCVPPEPCAGGGAGRGSELAEDLRSLTPTAANLDAARELDRQGVRAYGEGRFNDATLFFRASYRLGGPPSELWNIARCEERLDQPESAAHAIEAYLSRAGLSPEDRAGAQRELTMLRARPSALSITSTPNGAAVTVDGTSAVGATALVTPMSLELVPGTHTIVIKREGYRPQTIRVEARFGRAVTVDVTLGT